MMKSHFIAAFTVLFALSYASPVVATIGSGTAASSKFQLISLAQNGPYNNSGLFIAGFHTGAGENAAACYANQSSGNSFQYNSSHKSITTIGGSVGDRIPFSIGLLNQPPYNSTAPAGYEYVTINAGYKTSGFSLNALSVVEFSNQKFADFMTFAICYVNGISPYQSLGPQYQLLWRGSASKPSKACSDVVLKAVY